MVKDLPQVISVSEIDTISFSVYVKIRKCIMYGLPGTNIELDGTLDTKGYSVGLVLGNLYHELLNRLDDLAGLDCEKASEVLANYLDDYANRAGVLYSTDKIASVKVFKLKKEVNDIYMSVWGKFLEQERSTGSYLREKTFKSKEEDLIGVIDELYLEDEIIRLVDYKTTYKVKKLLSEHNLDQIHFYAYLINENFNKYPDETKILGISEASAAIEVDKSHSEKIALDMINARVSTNQKIKYHASLAELCSPDPRWCVSCKYKSICPSVINRKKRNLLPYNQEIIRIIVNKFEREKKGLVLYGISNGGGVDKGVALTVSNICLDTEDIEVIKNGDVLTLSGVTISNTSARVRCNEATEVYRSMILDE